MYQGLDPIVLCPLVNEINSFSFTHFGIEAAFIYLFTPIYFGFDIRTQNINDETTFLFSSETNHPL